MARPRITAHNHCMLAHERAEVAHMTSVLRRVHAVVVQHWPTGGARLVLR
jgi:hypothetical protein